jgi:hypothetical protein
MVERCVERLKELWFKDRGLTSSMVERVDAALAIYRRGDRMLDHSPTQLLATQRWEELAKCIFPRAPLDQELYRKKSDFMSDWYLVRDTLGQDVDEDLQDIIRGSNC